MMVWCHCVVALSLDDGVVSLCGVTVWCHCPLMMVWCHCVVSLCGVTVP